MKLPVLAFAALSLAACEDSGPVPFGGYGLSGGSSGSAGTSGSGGGSGYGGSGGYAGSGGCKGGPGTSCNAHDDCCQVSPNGNICVGSPIYKCASVCNMSSECENNCCVQLDGVSYGACITGSGLTCLP